MIKNVGLRWNKYEVVRSRITSLGPKNWAVVAEFFMFKGQCQICNHHDIYSIFQWHLLNLDLYSFDWKIFGGRWSSCSIFHWHQGSGSSSSIPCPCFSFEQGGPRGKYAKVVKEINILAIGACCTLGLQAKRLNRFFRDQSASTTTIHAPWCLSAQRILEPSPSLL